MIYNIYFLDFNTCRTGGSMTQNGRKVFKLNPSISRKMPSFYYLDKLERLNPEVHCTHRSKSAFAMHNVVKKYFVLLSSFLCSSIFTTYFINLKLWPSKAYELESFTMSKTDRHLLRQKVRKRISGMKTNTFMFPENWHFNSHFALRAAKTAVFAFII